MKKPPLITIVRIRPRIVLSVLIFTLALCASIRADNTANPGTTYSGEIEHGGRTRNYIVHAPADAASMKGIPLVFVMHGGGGNARHAMRNTGFNEKADEEGFIVVYPNGSGRMNNLMLTWNAVECCKYAADNNIDDVGFIDSLIDEMAGEYDIDLNRVYATGLSNGGMLTHHLGCRLSHRLAAVAPVAACVTTPDCEPSDPVSVIIFHGTGDMNVPYEGGVGPRALVKNNRKPVSYAVDLWTDRNDCDEKPDVKINGDVRADTYNCPRTGVDVVLYTLEGGAHSWPGGNKVFFIEDEPFSDISATDVMWDFFAEHPKTPAAN